MVDHCWMLPRNETRKVLTWNYLKQIEGDVSQKKLISFFICFIICMLKLF